MNKLHLFSDFMITASQRLLYVLGIALMVASCITKPMLDKHSAKAAVRIGAEALANPCAVSSPIPVVRVISDMVPDSRDKVKATFHFYESAGPNGKYNPLGSYTAGAGTIHARGQSSLSFPKKSFSINLGKETPLPLLGMPSSHKWVMIGNYIDTTNLVNKMSYDLYAEMGHFGPQSKHVQVCFNDQYWGLYTFGEKVNRGEGRVDTPKASKGGFIVKLVDDASNFCSVSDRQFDYEYPDYEDSNESERAAIKSTIDQYENTVIQGGDWRSLLNETAEIDYFILTDMFANPDSYYQDKNLFYFLNSDNKLEPVIWDFIWAFGPPYFVQNGNNPWPSIYFGNELMYGNNNYQYRVGYNQFCLMKYYMHDQQNVNQFKSRYQYWRSGNGHTSLLSDANIIKRWTSLVEPLESVIPPLKLSVYGLDQQRWGYYQPPKNGDPYTPRQIRDKLLKRLGVMDNKVPALELESLSGSCPLNPCRASCPSCR